MNFFEEEELPLLTFNPIRKSLEFHQKSLEIFSNFNRPFSVLSIIGQRDSGKSSFLNRLISNRAKGFQVSSGRSCNPPGIYMWGKPLNYQRCDEDSSQCVFLLDLQNFPEYLNPQLEKIHGFLSILLVFMSSALILNVKSLEALNSTLQTLSQIPIFFAWKPTLKVFVLNRDRNPNSNNADFELKMEKAFAESSKRDSVLKLMENREYLYLAIPSIDNVRGCLSFEKGFEDVNPEFIIEVMKIRSKILSSSPIHTLNPQNEFTGIVYTNYLNFMKEELSSNFDVRRSIYYKELNEAFIRKENEGLFKDSLDLYEFHTKEAILEKLPLTAIDLQKTHKGIKIVVLEFFQQRFLEKEFLPEYSNHLYARIKDRYASLKLLNEQESQKLLGEFIAREFQFIDKKLKQKEYESFDDYEKELKIFHAFYQENAPDLPRKHLLILEFLNKSILEGVSCLLPQDLKISFAKSDEFSTTIKEKTTIIQSSLSDPKSLTHTLTEELEKQKSNNILNEEIEKELSQLKRDYELLRLENRRLEAESKASLSLKYKMSEFEENMKVKSRDTLVLESEYRKELALLRQKLEFHERTIEEMGRKNKDHNQETKNLKSAHYTEIKELTLKYETLNRGLELEVKQLKDKAQELQTELENSHAKLAKERENSELAEGHFKSIIQEDNQSMKELRRELQELRNKDLEKSERLKNFHEKSLEELNETLKSVEENYRSKEKAFKELKLLHERDKAVMGQKIDFLEMELKEIKGKKAESSSIQEAFMKALELSEEYAKAPKNDEALDRLRQEIKQYEEEGKALRGKLESKDHEIEDLKRFRAKDSEELRKLQNQVLELRNWNERLKIETSDSQNLFTAEMEKIMTMKESMQIQYSDLKSKYLKEQSIWSEKVRILHEDLEDAERKLQLALKLRDEEKEITSRNQASLLESMEKKHCQQINELSGFYESRFIENRKKQSFLENNNKAFETGQKNQPLSTLSSINSFTSILEIAKPKNNFTQILNQETIDLEKEGLKNKIYELEQALNDSEARREVQKNELKREKSRQNLTIHENPRTDSKVLKKSINIYNTLQNPQNTPKGLSICTSVKSRSPLLNENKFSFHSKKPSFTEKSLLFNNEGNSTFSINELGVPSTKNSNRAFLLNQRNSSLEEMDIFDLKRLK